MLIVFEGLDGVGKTTQAKKLVKFLKSRNYDAIYVREPGGSNVGEKIRNILLDADEDISSEVEVLLFSASRAQLVHDVIKPHLSKPKGVVVSDRYYHSTIAYQGAGRNLHIGNLRTVSQFAIHGAEPDYVFLLDMYPDVALSRLKRLRGENNTDRYESESLPFFRKVYQAYQRMARTEANFRIINGVQTQDQIHTDVISILKEDGKLY